MALPIKNYTNALVSAVNDGKRFRTRDGADQHWVFDPAVHRWEAARTDAEGKPARDAAGLGLRLTAQAGQSPTILPVSLGIMTCLPFRDPSDALVQQRLLVHLSWSDLKRLRYNTNTGEFFDAGDVRLVYELSPSMSDRLKTRLLAHYAAGRFEPLFAPGVLLRRDTEGTAGALDTFSDFNNPQQLEGWIAGNSAVWWRFAAGVAQADADLLTMMAGEVLTLYAEAGFGRAGEPLTWYRINPGYLMRRIRAAGETAAQYDALCEQFTDLGVANGRQAAYDRLTPSDSGGAIAPSETLARADITVVSGGSMETTVLQPYGVVPAELFSFITSDEINIFSARLQGKELWVRCRQPTITQQAYENAWRRLQVRRDPAHPNVRERFDVNAFREFQATNLPYELTFVQAASRPTGLEDELLPLIGYGVAGWHTGLVAGATLDRTVVPQEAPEYRPDHPRFKPKLNAAAEAAALAAGDTRPDHRHQLRRLFPLRYSFSADGDQDSDLEFTVTQDETDCIRQESVFHLNWAVTGIGLFYYQGDLAYQAEDVKAQGHREGGNAAAPTPRYRSLTIPPRRLFRPLKPDEYAPIVTGARPRYSRVTPAPENWRDVFDLQIVPRYDLYRDALKAIDGGAAPPLGVNVPPVFNRLITFLQNLPQASALSNDWVLDFLATLPNLQDARTQLANPNNDQLQINSFWRPPEHNETVSELRQSPHQDRRAFDIQSKGGRSILNLIALHFAGDELLAAANTPLSQVLLEHLSRLFVYSGYDDSLASRLVSKVGNVFKLRLVANGPDVDLNAFWGQSPMGEDDNVPAMGVPQVTLLKEFAAQFAAFQSSVGRPPDWPNPTVDRVYFFALANASHVHFTIK